MMTQVGDLVDRFGYNFPDSLREYTDFESSVTSELSLDILPTPC